jgi:uncharacterized delta-60 repeat protein
MRAFAHALLGTSYLISAVAVALPSELDTTFAGGGSQILGSARSHTSVRVRPDGRVVAVVADDYAGTISIVQLNADGTFDTTFGSGSGKVSEAQICAAVPPGKDCGFGTRTTLELQDDGKILLSLAEKFGLSSQKFGVVRLLADGRVDSAFGDGGVASLPILDDTYDAAVGIAVLSDGRIVIGGTSSQLNSGTLFPSAARYLPSGMVDTTFGNNGRMTLPKNIQIIYEFFAQPDGKLVWVGAESVQSGHLDPFILRTLPNGASDASFAVGGLFRSTAIPQATVLDAALQADGKMLVAGSGFSYYGGAKISLIRLTTGGAIDPSFGLDGTVHLPLPGGFGAVGARVAVDSGQRIIVAATAADPVNSIAVKLPFREIAVARFTDDGTPDVTFAAHGVTTFWAGFGSSANCVGIGPGDAIIVGGTIDLVPFYVIHDIYNRQEQATVFRLKGGTGTVIQTVAQAAAVEFYHSGFNHYFISATPYEIAVVDHNPEWARTGATFNVWVEDAPDLSPVCRFFSDQSFAPRSSHFYTPYAAECAGLRAGMVWKYEGDVFRLALPVGASGLGTCQSGSVPQYRLYNNGQGGAPNHRYTTSLHTVDDMTASGWIVEGEAQTKVFACVPTPSRVN